MQYNKVLNSIVAILSNEVHWQIKLFAFILQLKNPIKIKKKKKLLKIYIAFSSLSIPRILYHMHNVCII